MVAKSGSASHLEFVVTKVPSLVRSNMYSTPKTLKLQHANRLRRPETLRVMTFPWLKDVYSSAPFKSDGLGTNYQRRWNSNGPEAI